MGKKGKRPPNAPNGRKKGQLNKLTVAAKQAFEQAFDGLGGVEGLIAWGRKNRGAFYVLYARLIPEARTGSTALVNINLGGSGPLTPEQAYQAICGDPAADIEQIQQRVRLIEAPAIPAPNAACDTE